MPTARHRSLFPSRLRQSTGAVTLLTIGLYVAFALAVLVRYDWNPLWFEWMGERYANLKEGGSTGYDSQFIYYIARDGVAALPHLDNPPYRLQRILLPALLRAVTLGSPSAIPWATILINLAAIAVTTWLLASYLRERNVSPWYALIYPLYAGTFMAFTRGLTEPLAFCLAAGGVLLWLRDKRGWSALLLALAALTKETALLFAVGVAVDALQRREWKALLWPILSAIPLALWELALYLRFGVFAMSAGPHLTLVPLAGILPYVTREPARLASLLLVGLPAAFGFGAAMVLLVRGRRFSPLTWCLLLNSVFVLIMPFKVYAELMHSGRNAAGLILALVLVLPWFGQRLRALLTLWLTLPTASWVLPILYSAPWTSLAALCRMFA